MSPLEQQALVARQLGALLRHGRSWTEALSLVEPGLPAGPGREFIVTRRREAAAGREGAEPTSEALEQEALGIEARLEAQAALRLGRVFFSFSLGGSLLLGSAMAWLAPSVLPSELSLTDTGLMTVIGAARYLGPPLGLLGLLLPWRLGFKIAPGAREHELAEALVRMVGADPTGVETLALPLYDNERIWLGRRREQIGQASALVELARELSAQGRGRVRLLRQVGPMLALTMGVFALLPWTLLHLGMFFHTAGLIGEGP